ncbi:MAG: pyridoxamine 5'-phosphate oxidase family protein [Christensenellaceae bacterium]|nr:pyridoxamine 5'-phosphate oxidase family protein [Christensenellaceae bacterium]
MLEAIGYLHAAARGTVIEAAQLRRQDKSLEEKAAIVSILDECKVCRLGIAEAGESAYVVPLNFGYTWPQDGALSLYFHGAKTGKKMSLLRRCPVVAFEMDCGHTLKPAEEACGYGYAFRSLMGEGQVVFLEDAGQKAEGLSALMLRQTGRRFDFDAAATENVAVYRLDVHRISAKEGK